MTRRPTTVAARLELVSGRLMRLFRRHAAAGLSASQISALATVEEGGAMRISALAIHESLVAPAATRLVTGLEERGLLERSNDPCDGRATLVSLTADGARTLEEIRRARAVGMEERLGALSPRERRVLEEVLPILEKLAVP